MIELLDRVAGAAGRRETWIAIAIGAGVFGAPLHAALVALRRRRKPSEGGEVRRLARSLAVATRLVWEKDRALAEVGEQRDRALADLAAARYRLRAAGLDPDWP